jgi:group I intron endonuclease
LKSVVYVITNNVTDKKYVGQTINGIDSRVHGHKSAIQRGSTTPFHKAVKKYGWENFSVETFECPVDRLDEFEQTMIINLAETEAGIYNTHYSPKFSKCIPRTYVSERVMDTIEHLINKYGMSRSAAIRHLLDNGIQYLAIYGDGINEDGED